MNEEETAQRPTVLLAGAPDERRQILVAALSAEYEILAGDNAETTLMLLEEIPEINVVIVFGTEAAVDLLSRIRSAQSMLVRQKPVLTAVSEDDETSKHLMLESGASDLVTFPVDPLQLLATARSLVELDMAARASREGAMQDPLTGVASKRYFFAKGAQDVALALRHQEKLAVFRFELEGLRASYDQHGDEVADALLVWMAGLLKKNCRQEDTVARIGGSEFAVLAPRTDET